MMSCAIGMRQGEGLSNIATFRKRMAHDRMSQ
jgi:hypothetical protein